MTVLLLFDFLKVTYRIIFNYLYFLLKLSLTATEKGETDIHSQITFSSTPFFKILRVTRTEFVKQ